MAVDPLLAGIRDKLDGPYSTSDAIAGTLCTEWAERLGLTAGIPIPVGAFDAHWDAIGAGMNGAARIEHWESGARGSSPLIRHASEAALRMVRNG